MLNCSHDEMKLKENSFKTVLKLFCFSFISLCGQFYCCSWLPSSKVSLIEESVLRRAAWHASYANRPIRKQALWADQVP